MTDLKIKITDDFNEKTFIEDLTKLKEEKEEKLTLCRRAKVKKDFRTVLILIVYVLFALTFIYVGMNPIFAFGLSSFIFAAGIPFYEMGMGEFLYTKPSEIEKEVEALNNAVMFPKEETFEPLSEINSLVDIYQAYYFHTHYKNIVITDMEFDDNYFYASITIKNKKTDETIEFKFEDIDEHGKNYIGIVIENSGVKLFVPTEEETNYEIEY